MFSTSLCLFLAFTKKGTSMINFSNKACLRSRNSRMIAQLDTNLVDYFYRLKLPPDKLFATYVWIDGTGINLRSKDRVLKHTPTDINEVPYWSYDGTSMNEIKCDYPDVVLKPVALYKDPFRMGPHIIVLCETYLDNVPTLTNNRKYLSDQIALHKDEEPWFGLEQEYTVLDLKGRVIGWPRRGRLPSKYQHSYCGVGAKYVVGRDISEAHARCCLYSGLDFEGTNVEVMFGSWEWQIGASVGTKAADDIWMSRYFMARIAEKYGVQVSYHPKPLGPDFPGIGMHHNFSCKSTRSDGGFDVILNMMKKLEKNHKKHIARYGLKDCNTNLERLSGKFETSSYKKFSWGVGDRSLSVCIPRSVKEAGKGYFEDRRPAGDCDPYLVCGLILETCLGDRKSQGKDISHDSRKRNEFFKI